MIEIVRFAASSLWLILAIVVYVRFNQWDKRFSQLYDEIKKNIRGEKDNGDM